MSTRQAIDTRPEGKWLQANREALAREIVRRRGRYAYAYSELGAVEVVCSVLDELATILSSTTKAGT